MAKKSNYIADSFNELKTNVSWTPWSEVQRYTIIVAIFTVLFSLAIWGVDTVFQKAIAGFFNIING
ncbi:preprotein translocase subunit SecE [Capnocytophaga sp. ARDL2]|uniref:preprotein translocase subunit SecE n=1 Tax=Capnocytophaga sp. ARDL2 TaxID=3238809 RepID=UPI0035591D41